MILTSIHHDSRIHSFRPHALALLLVAFGICFLGLFERCDQQIGVRSGRFEKSEQDQVEQVFGSEPFPSTDLGLIKFFGVRTELSWSNFGVLPFQGEQSELDQFWGVRTDLRWPSWSNFGVRQIFRVRKQCLREVSKMVRTWGKNAIYSCEKRFLRCVSNGVRTGLWGKIFLCQSLRWVSKWCQNWSFRQEGKKSCKKEWDVSQKWSQNWSLRQDKFFVWEKSLRCNCFVWGRVLEVSRKNGVRTAPWGKKTIFVWGRVLEMSLKMVSGLILEARCESPWAEVSELVLEARRQIFSFEEESLRWVSKMVLELLLEARRQFSCEEESLRWVSKWCQDWSLRQDVKESLSWGVRTGPGGKKANFFVWRRVLEVSLKNGVRTVLKARQIFS